MVIIPVAGEDGRDFITVEHCGDDFLAALADSIADIEDWDDPQAIESETCAALSGILEREEKMEGDAFGEASCGINAGDSMTVYPSADDDSDLEILSDMDMGRSRFLSREADNTSSVDNFTSVGKVSSRSMVIHLCACFVICLLFTMTLLPYFL